MSKVITFRLIGVPPGAPFSGTVAFRNTINQPGKYIWDMVALWRRIDSSLPTIVEIAGFYDEPIICDVEDAASHDYLTSLRTR